MAPKPKGQPTSPSAKGASKPAPDAGPPLSQSEKFIQTAREIGADETGERTDEALRAIGRARQKPKH